MLPLIGGCFAYKNRCLSRPEPIRKRPFLYLWSIDRRRAQGLNLQPPTSRRGSILLSYPAYANARRGVNRAGVGPPFVRAAGATCRAGIMAVGALVPTDSAPLLPARAGCVNPKRTNAGLLRDARRRQVDHGCGPPCRDFATAYKAAAPRSAAGREHPQPIAASCWPPGVSSRVLPGSRNGILATMRARPPQRGDDQSRLPQSQSV